jgi:RNA polymerase sigma-70 factor
MGCAELCCDNGSTVSDEPLVAAIPDEWTKLFDAAVRVHGNLDLPQSRFYQRIERSIRNYLGDKPAAREREQFVRQLYACDLYLASACVMGNERAWSVVYECYGQSVSGYLRLVSLQRRSAVADTASGVFAELFLPGRSGVSRIDSYDGRAPLRLWIRKVIVNRSVNDGNLLSHRQRCDISRADRVHDLAATPELAFERERAAGLLRGALDTCGASMTESEGWLLYMRFVEQLRLSEIGAILGVHTSTACRSLERAVGRLRYGVRGLNRETLTPSKEMANVALEWLMCRQMPERDGITPTQAAVRGCAEQT